MTMIPELTEDQFVRYVKIFLALAGTAFVIAAAFVFL